MCMLGGGIEADLPRSTCPYIDTGGLAKRFQMGSRLEQPTAGENVLAGFVVVDAGSMRWPTDPPQIIHGHCLTQSKTGLTNIHTRRHTHLLFGVHLRDNQLSKDWIHPTRFTAHCHKSTPWYL